jgi:hypothetical protein
MEHEESSSQNTNNYPNQPVNCDPPAWLSTGELENELLTAIYQATVENTAELAPALAEADDYFARDEEESSAEYRRSLLRHLSHFRPQLADLLGWSSTK